MASCCNADGNSHILGTDRNDGNSSLNAYYDNPDNKWNRENGFAFVLAQLFSFPNPALVRGLVLIFSFDVSTPSAEHPSDLIKGFREYCVFLCIE
jgi:hypothetical protein